MFESNYYILVVREILLDKNFEVVRNETRYFVKNKLTRVGIDKEDREVVEML